MADLIFWGLIVLWFGLMLVWAWLLATVVALPRSNKP